MAAVALQPVLGSTLARLSRPASHTQDLAVVVLLMLIPLLAPSNGEPTGFSTIARALGIAALKARVFGQSLPCHAMRHRQVAVRCWKLVHGRLGLCAQIV